MIQSFLFNTPTLNILSSFSIFTIFLLFLPSFILSLVSKIVSRVAYRANLSRQTGFNGLILAIAIAHLCIFVLSLSLLALFKLQGDAEEKEVLILLASLESEVQQHVLAIMAG